jgi:hypothetical protein
MRRAFAILTALALSAPAFSGEITLSLDTCQIINDQDDNSQPSKLLIHFALPDEVMGKEVFYAKFTTTFALGNVGRDSLLELRFCPLFLAPPDDAPDYQSLEAITDSMSAGSFICRIGNEARFEVYLTEFVREVAEGVRPNNGLVGTFDLLGDANIVLPENLGEAIRRNAVLRVIYK